jgi:hypothetical protein
MPQRKYHRSLVDRKALPVLLFWGTIYYLLYKAEPTLVTDAIHELSRFAAYIGSAVTQH